ncbi:hypothetical protein FHS42_006001 [Streptomyces zagrosensis]|uniref:Uncharacterized protein n=1 Tax=Streptomyces zagrosensis TaxID=1042984 RepID=A0A7W9V180_9ACTN|nr:hypothetical protein [Streptomyces zagrosensis]
MGGARTIGAALHAARVSDAVPIPAVRPHSVVRAALPPTARRPRATLRTHATRRPTTRIPGMFRLRG